MWNRVEGHHHSRGFRAMEDRVRAIDVLEASDTKAGRAGDTHCAIIHEAHK
jgi:hypothetical protein